MAWAPSWVALREERELYRQSAGVCGRGLKEMDSCIPKEHARGRSGGRDDVDGRRSHVDGVQGEETEQRKNTRRSGVGGVGERVSSRVQPSFLMLLSYSYAAPHVYHCICILR